MSDQDRSRNHRDRQPRPEQAERPQWQQRVDRPERADKPKSPLIPHEITPEDLEMGVRVQLKTLTAENAEMVARHLAMVAIVADQDPELAHRHALAAASRAGRIAALDHESFDDAMENCSVIQRLVCFFACIGVYPFTHSGSKFNKVRNGFWCVIRK